MSADADTDSGSGSGDNNTRPLDAVTLTTDSEGRYYDGHEEVSYVENKDALASHHIATANGWSDSPDRTPLANLRTALEATSEYDRRRATVRAFVFAFVRGYGPESTSEALETLESEADVRVPGGEGT